MTPHKDDNPSDSSIAALLERAMGGDRPDGGTGSPDGGKAADRPKADGNNADGNNADGNSGAKKDAARTSPKVDPKVDPKAAPKAAPKADGKETAGGGGKGDSKGDGDKRGATDGEAARSFSQMVKERATESDSRPNATTNLRKIINGDMLNTEVVRRQIGVFLLITAFIIVYITNRYACQRDLVKIDKLNKELTNAKFRALSSTSELTEKSRESRVLDLLRLCNDSTLHIASQPPYIIPVPEEDGE